MPEHIHPVHHSEHLGRAFSLPARPSRRVGREIAKAAERTAVAAVEAEATVLLSHIGLQGADLLAGQLINMHDRHGDIALHIATPIVEAYGARVAAIIRGEF